MSITNSLGSMTKALADRSQSVADPAYANILSSIKEQPVLTDIDENVNKDIGLAKGIKARTDARYGQHIPGNILAEMDRLSALEAASTKAQQFNASKFFSGEQQGGILGSLMDYSTSMTGLGVTSKAKAENAASQRMNAIANAQAQQDAATTGMMSTVASAALLALL